MNAELKPTGDRKTKFWKNQKNTFGTLPGKEGTCPGCTTKHGGCCHVAEGHKNPECYVYNLMSAYGGVKGALSHNTELLKKAKHDKRVALLKAEFERFQTAELRRDNPQLFYRVHWSGDVFHPDYAAALSEAMNAFPAVHFWAYTRTFSAAEALANNTPNLTLYLSLDTVNFSDGLNTFYASKHKHNNMQICYMAKKNDFHERYKEARANLKAKYGSVRWPHVPPDLRTCPVDEGKLPLEQGCSKCQGCVSDQAGWTPKATWFQS